MIETSKLYNFNYMQTKMASNLVTHSKSVNEFETRPKNNKQVDNLSFRTAIEQTVLCHLEELKQISNHRIHTLQLINILESNIRGIAQLYEEPHITYSLNQKLTAIEIDIAALVKAGYSTKYIARTLKKSTDCIDIYRKQIRKKLGISRCKINLRNYLNLACD